MKKKHIILAVVIVSTILLIFICCIVVQNLFFLNIKSDDVSKIEYYTSVDPTNSETININDKSEISNIISTFNGSVFKRESVPPTGMVPNLIVYDRNNNIKVELSSTGNFLYYNQNYYSRINNMTLSEMDKFSKNIANIMDKYKEN